MEGGLISGMQGCFCRFGVAAAGDREHPTFACRRRHGDKLGKSAFASTTSRSSPARGRWLAACHTPVPWGGAHEIRNGEPWRRNPDGMLVVPAPALLRSVWLRSRVGLKERHSTPPLCPATLPFFLFRCISSVSARARQTVPPLLSPSGSHRPELGTIEVVPTPNRPTTLHLSPGPYQGRHLLAPTTPESFTICPLSAICNLPSALCPLSSALCHSCSLAPFLLFPIPSFRRQSQPTWLLTGPRIKPDTSCLRRPWSTATRRTPPLFAYVDAPRATCYHGLPAADTRTRSTC